MAGDPTCVFCRIIAGEIPAAKILDTADCVAFLDIEPVAPGHLLLVPKAHHATLAETPPEILAAATAELPRLARALARATGLEALNVVQNNGRTAGQTVDHVHFHLIPRQPGDRFQIHWSRGKMAPGTLEALRDRITAAL